MHIFFFFCWVKCLNFCITHIKSCIPRKLILGHYMIINFWQISRNYSKIYSTTLCATNVWYFRKQSILFLIQILKQILSSDLSLWAISVLYNRTSRLTRQSGPQWFHSISCVKYYYIWRIKYYKDKLIISWIATSNMKQYLQYLFI